MTHRMPRREFLGAISTLAAASAFPCETLFARERLYPPVDLSHFDTPITPAPSEIHFGYAAITWGGNDREAIEDIETLGSPVKAFVRERCIVGPGRRFLVDNLFEGWSEWCTAENRKDAGTKEWFGRNLHSAVPGLGMSKPRADGKQVRYYEGIEMRPEYMPTMMIEEKKK